MPNLMLLRTHPDIVNNTNTIIILNKLVSKTEHTSTREKLFGKFVTEDVSLANEIALNKFSSGPDFESIAMIIASLIMATQIGM